MSPFYEEKDRMTGEVRSSAGQEIRPGSLHLLEIRSASLPADSRNGGSRLKTLGKGYCKYDGQLRALMN